MVLDFWFHANLRHKSNQNLNEITNFFYKQLNQINIEKPDLSEYYVKWLISKVINILTAKILEMVTNGDNITIAMKYEVLYPWIDIFTFGLGQLERSKIHAKFHCEYLVD